MERKSYNLENRRNNRVSVKPNKPHLARRGELGTPFTHWRGFLFFERVIIERLIMQDQNFYKHGYCLWSFEKDLIDSSYTDTESNELIEDNEPIDADYQRCNHNNIYSHHNLYGRHVAGFNSERIKKIKDNEFITLVEAALLISDRLGEYNQYISDASAIFSMAIEHGEIDPREPDILMPYSKIQHLPEWEEGCVYGRYKRIDSTWKITPKEAAEFAILKGYSEQLFIDLLSETPTDNKDKLDPEAEAKKLGGKERNNLLRIILALCEKQGIHPNDKGLDQELEKILAQKGFNEPLSRAIKEHLVKAANLG